MTAEEVLKYIQLISRKSFIICHSGNDWKPEYEIEMKKINQELAYFVLWWMQSILKERSLRDVHSNRSSINFLFWCDVYHFISDHT